MKITIVFDLDGIIATCDEPNWNKFKSDTDLYTYIKNRKLRFNPHKYTNDEFYILTSRESKYRTVTEQWLEKHKIKPIHMFMFNSNYYSEFNDENRIKHKQNILKALTINSDAIIFYDDSEYIRKGIQILSFKEFLPWVVLDENKVHDHKENFKYIEQQISIINNLLELNNMLSSTTKYISFKENEQLKLSQHVDK